MLLLIGQTKTKSLARHVLRYVFRYTSIYHHLLDVRTAICLDRDVAVCTVDDAARIKIPRVVCHSLDRRFVLAGEGYTRQHATINECRLPDACHTIADRYTCKSATIVERIISNARHTRWDRHRRQAAAPIKHILSNACNTIWNHHTCKTVA